ncbi:MAG: DUF2723 domain-containing protein [Deltaproteobacteria bacterium]|nr:DUF2723 domain-containing protein [Deltaproteobacteria bacterium]
MRALATRWLWQRGLALGLLVFALYALLAPPFVTDGDNAEFSTLAATGGVGHPSGYPAYVLWLRLTSWLPGSTPAHTAALATSILGAALVVVLHAACRAWGARPGAATASALVFAIGPIVLRNHIKAEVFAMNGLVVAAVIWLAAAHGPLRGARRTFALGLVAGLGIADHLTCVLVAPVGLLGAVRGVREASSRAPAESAERGEDASNGPLSGSSYGGRRSAPLAIGLGVAGLVAGLLPYLYLFAAPASLVSWGSVDSVSDLLHVFLRKDYGGPGAFAGSGKGVDVVANLAALGAGLARGWLWLLLPVGAVGWVRRVRAREVTGCEPRAGWIALAAAWLLCGPLLVLRFDLEPVGFGLAICERFYLLPLMMLAVPIALGLDDAYDAVARHLPPRSAPLLAVAGAIGALLAAAPSIRQVARVHNAAVEQYVLNLLGTLPRDAVLISSDDATYWTILYLQSTQGLRTDVTNVQWTMLSIGWYAEQLGRRGVGMAAGPPYPSQQLALGLLQRGRPVFADLAQQRILEMFPGYPYGPIVHLVPLGQKTPPIEDILRINRDIYDRFELPYDLPGPDDELITELHRRYASTWNALGKRLESLGRKQDAEEAYARARAIGPQE